MASYDSWKEAAQEDFCPVQHPTWRYEVNSVSQENPLKKIIDDIGETVKLVEYGSSVSGMIQSWNERYETSSLVHQALEELWVKDEPFFV